MLDGVDAGLQRHALAGGGEAVHRAGLVEGVRLVHHRVELFLRHVADVRLFLVGAAAAGGAGLDDVAAGQEVGARELAQFPRPVGGLEAEADGGARLDQRQMRAGDGGEAGDEHARAFENAGIEGIADGAGFRHQQAALRVEAEIAQRGESHVEAELGVEDAVHLLQLGRDFPLRHAVIMESEAVEHHRVQVNVHHARDQRALAAVEHVGALRDLDAVLAADLVDALALEHDHGILLRGRAGAVDHAGRGDVFDRACF